jgi:transcriptional regulator with XRE-family HTH domain
MDIRRKVGLNVAKHRQAMGLSQEAFAFDCGVHRTYISGIERGVRNPTISVLERIAGHLGVSPGRLLDEEPPKPKKGRKTRSA